MSFSRESCDPIDRAYSLALNPCISESSNALVTGLHSGTRYSTLQPRIIQLPGGEFFGSSDPSEAALHENLVATTTSELSVIEIAISITLNSRIALFRIRIQASVKGDNSEDIDHLKCARMHLRERKCFLKAETRSRTSRVIDEPSLPSLAAFFSQCHRYVLSNCSVRRGGHRRRMQLAVGAKNAFALIYPRHRRK